MIRLVPLLCFLLLALQATGQQVTFRGTIATESGEKLEGAHLLPASDWKLGSSTDSAGGFVLTAPRATLTDTVEVSFIGFETVQILWNRQENLQKAIVLREKMTLGEVVVEAPGVAASPFTVRRMNRLEIYTNPAAKADALLAVNALPASTTLDESANISLRGSSPAETGIYLNEVPVYDAIKFAQLDGIGTFSIFNTDLIQSLHVFPGNPPLEYGGATSGAVVLETTDAVPEAASHQVALNLAGAGARTTLPTGKKTGITAFANLQGSYALRVLNGDALEEIPYFGLADAGLHGVTQWNERLKLRVYHYSLWEAYDFRNRQPTGESLFTQRRNRHLTIGNLLWLQGAGIVTVNGGYSRGSTAFGDGALLDASVENRDVFLSLNYQRDAGEWLLKTGISYDYRREAVAGTFPEFDFAPGPPHPAVTVEEATQRKVPELYAFVRRPLGAGWSTGVGLRKNVAAGQVPDWWSGQGTMQKSWSNNLRLTLSAGQYNQFVLAGQGLETAMHIQSRQAGADLHWQAGIAEGQVSLFWKTTERKTDEVESLGGELWIKLQPWERLTAEVSYTYLRARERLPETGEERLGTYDLPYFVRANGKYRFPRQWEANVVIFARPGSFYRPVAGATYREDLQVWEPVYAPPGNRERLPSYFRLDASLSKLWLAGDDMALVTYLTASNVSNHQNVRTLTYNADYSSASEAFFGLRTVFFGAVLEF